jgi:hypothetical protein
MGERTGRLAGLAFRHSRPPSLRGQEFQGYSPQGTVQGPVGKVSFANVHFACLVLSNAKEPLVSRAALVAPCLRFLGLRVGQRFFVGPVELTLQILLWLVTSVLGHPHLSLWTNSRPLWKTLSFERKNAVMLITINDRITLSRPRFRCSRSMSPCSPRAEALNYRPVSRVEAQAAKFVEGRAFPRGK